MITVPSRLPQLDAQCEQTGPGEGRDELVYGVLILLLALDNLTAARAASAAKSSSIPEGAA